MTNKEFYREFGNIDPKMIEAAAPAEKVQKKKKNTWVKWASLAACFALAIMIAIPFINKINAPNINAGFFGDGDASIFAPHRDDFTPKIENSILTQFENTDEVKKVYLLRRNDWFLSEDLTDFSQAVSTDVIYVSLGEKQGDNINNSYSWYSVNDENNVEWVASSHSSNHTSLPFGFVGLTYETINTSLAGIEYEDYIITYSQRVYTVFVWVRCENEDIIITYPTRPDLLGIENGGIYKLGELQSALKNAYIKAIVDSTK